MQTSTATAIAAGLVLATLASFAEPARAEAAVSLSSPGTVFASAPYTLGFEFSVNTPVDLLSLGVYDHLSDGLEAPAQVALWVAGTTTPLLAAEVAGGTAAALLDGFRYAPVAAFRLQPGTSYVVAAYLDGGWASSFGLGQGGTASVAPQINLLGDRFGVDLGALVYPDQSDGAGQRAWLGANFQLAPVPEPAVAALLLPGLLGLALRVRRRPGA